MNVNLLSALHTVEAYFIPYYTAVRLRPPPLDSKTPQTSVVFLSRVDPERTK